MINGNIGGISICAVIVTFHPDLSVLEEQLSIVCRQVDVIVVVDNGSDAEVTDWLRSREGLELILAGENLGVAAAQNRGIRRAQELGCSHVLFLDQDSVPAVDMVVQLLAAEKDCMARGERVAAVGPRFIDRATGAETWFHGRGLVRYRYLKSANNEGSHLVRADLLIASGMLVRSDVFAVVGMMDEVLFIDLVDTEWCLRAAGAGFRIFGVGDALMYHSIGSGSVKAPGGTGRRGTFPVHPPRRYYYMFRNSIILSPRAGIPFWWKLNNAMELLFMLLFLPIVSSERVATFSMILRGIIDGATGKTGKYAD